MKFLSFSSSFITKQHNQKQQSHHLSKRTMNVKNEAVNNAIDTSRKNSCVSINSCSSRENDDSFTECKIASSPSSLVPVSVIKRNYSVSSSPRSSSEITDHPFIDLKDEDTEMMHFEENKDISTTLSYDEITKLLGKNSSIDDYLCNLFEEEKSNNSLSWYNKVQSKKSTHHSRRNAIEWIRNTSMKLKLQGTTLFKSIYYFDKLCSIKQMNPVHLTIVAAVCLYIASKFNEREYDIPDLRKISGECGYDYSSNVFTSSEMKILSALDFRLKVVLPIDFIDYYIYRKGAVFDDDTIDHMSDSNLHLKQNLRKDLHNFCVFFLHISNLCYSFWKYKSSLVAFAVLCAARRAMKITPYFNTKLTDFAHYEPNDVAECFHKLWGKYQDKFPEKAKVFEALQPKSLIDF